MVGEDESDIATPDNDVAGSIGVALSGGGYRASLLAMGAMLALVDRGLNERVEVLSSVSGGSITNAVLAHESVARRVDFRGLAPEQLDERAKRLVHTICTSSVLPVRPLLVVVAVSPGYLAYYISGPHVGVAVQWLLTMAVVLTSELVAVGPNVVQGLDAKFGLENMALAGIAGSGIAHEFCSTDLVTGFPVTFSTGTSDVRRRVPQAGRRQCRRADPAAPRWWTIASAAVRLYRWPGTALRGVDRWLGNTASAEQPADPEPLPAERAVERPWLTLAKVVRASAAFPGIPPKAMRFVADSSAAAESPASAVRLGRWTLLGDGGIWNNLGTQAIEEIPERDDLPILCVNASAALRPSRVWPYFIPGIAQASAFARSAMILSRNTVDPRVETIDRGVAEWTRNASGPDGPLVWQHPPRAVVADMRTLEQTSQTIGTLGVDVGHSTLTVHRWWTTLAATVPTGEVLTKTTLARVTQREADLLVRRGYTNAWLASLLLRPFDSAEIENAAVANICARLDHILKVRPTLAQRAWTALLRFHRARRGARDHRQPDSDRAVSASGEP